VAPPGQPLVERQRQQEGGDMSYGVHVQGSIEIERPVQEVFDFVADQRNEPVYNPEMTASEKLTEGAVGVGTRYRAVTEGYGKPITMDIEVTGFERPRSIDTSTHMQQMDIHGGMTFEETPTGTRMSWSWSLYPAGVLRLASPLIARMGRKSEGVIWTGLKTYLEKHRDS
jgi:hypothetical protein